MQLPLDALGSPPERRARTGRTVFQSHPSSLYGKRRTEAPVFEGFLGTVRGHHRVHCGRPRGHCLRMCVSVAAGNRVQ